MQDPSQAELRANKQIACMNILFLTPTYKPAYVYGGVTVVTSLLAESLVKSGHDVTVFTTNGNGETELEIEADNELIVDGVKVFYFKRFSRGHSHLSPAFWKMIYLNANKFDIVHLHSWWNPPMVIAAAICKFRGVRPVLSPHGMLCEYILNTNNKRTKQLLHYVIGKYLLENTFLHVSSEMEWNESQEMIGGNWTGAIIPNLVESEYFEHTKIRNDNEPFVIGFLSRIDPKKRLDLLIQALSEVTFDYRLKIAGNGEDDYISYLKKLAVECGNADKIDWVGWKNKVQKYEFYSSIDLFALLSFNENFGVVVIEALSVGTPVFLSSEVGLSKYVVQNQLGWISEGSISKVIEKLESIYKDSEKRLQIQEKAPVDIKRDFNWRSLTNRYLEFYSNVNNRLLLKSEVSL